MTGTPWPLRPVERRAQSSKDSPTVFAGLSGSWGLRSKIRIRIALAGTVFHKLYHHRRKNWSNLRMRGVHRGICAVRSPTTEWYEICTLSSGALLMSEPDPKLDHLLRTAIEQTRLLRLRYRNKERIVEPHDYGRHNGVIKLLTWQIGGASSGPLPNWRWMETGLISDAH